MKSKQEAREPRNVPHIGQRIVKTTVAVFLCLLFYYLRGYRGQAMPTEAAITAIICMQPYVRDTRDYAINRFTGTLIGAAWGLALLFLLLIFPALGRNLPGLYVLMGLGVMMSLYTAVLLRMPDASSLAAIVFVCIVISFPEIDNPLRSTFQQILGVLVGTTIAIVVNVFRLPRVKQPDQVFFVRTRDLAPDRFSPIPQAALFRLSYLIQDGARICLMSEHAPAFLTLQLSETQLNVPLIVMDGAAIYDTRENSFLYAETIRPEDSTRLRDHLKGMDVSFFLYTVHKDRICIFHQGRLREAERKILDRLKSSPYRSYLDGELYEAREIVYFKIIDEDAAVHQLAASLQDFLQTRHLRWAVRPQSEPGVSGLYLYSASSGMKQAEDQLMKLLREENPRLSQVEVSLRGGYRSEPDAMHLLHKLGNAYEPLRWLPHKRKDKSEK